jgi:signal transduction histidine kinase
MLSFSLGACYSVQGKSGRSIEFRKITPGAHSLVNAVRVGHLVPAIVQVQGLLVDAMSLSPGGHRVTFTYSGISLLAPERVRFKCELEESGLTAAREPVYTNLALGSYRFRVMASNSDGIWNTAEMVTPFDVAPAFWQTWWFLLCCVLVAALVALVFLRLRVSRVAQQTKLRFEERLAERTRIAQELHDTLLQGIISASMQLHVVAGQIPADSSDKPALERVLNLMGRVTEEGRSAVAGLRSLESSSVDLGRAFSEVHQQFDPQNHVAFQVIAEGLPRPIHPMIREEIYSIGREALTNAFRHAQPSSMEVELQYATDALRVLVRDNGLGFDSEALHNGRDGHWGLCGMRERAKRIHAKFRVMSRPSAGTEVELNVPGQVAFIPKPTNATSKWWSRVRPHWNEAAERSSSEYEQ